MDEVTFLGGVNMIDKIKQIEISAKEKINSAKIVMKLKN